MSIDKLVKEIEQQVKLAEEEANKQVRAAIFHVSNNIINRTPVGNDVFWKSKAPKGYSGGQLRGNWRTSVGKALTTTVKTTQKGESGIATSGVSRGVAKFDLNNEGKPFYLANNLPYAEIINNGWSVQPGVGIKWVDKEVAKFDSILNQLVKKSQL